MANEKRLIDANALIDEIDGIYQRHYVNSAYQFIHDFFRAMFRRIHNAPTVDAIPVSWLKEKLKGHPELTYATTDGIQAVLRLWGERKDND